MGLNLEYITANYFAFDLPVPYQLKCGVTINIKPVLLTDSLIFNTSCGILQIDKNQSSDVEVIQMSYLHFLIAKVCKDKATTQQLVNICLLCLGMKSPFFIENEKGKLLLCDLDIDGNPAYTITAKEFDEIRKIILYQNLPNYDDEYINPDLKRNMEEIDRLKNQQFSLPNLERRIAIISSHSGITKEEQLRMTLRSHTMLFEEVRGEVEFMALKAIASFSGKGEEIQWIYRKQKGKFDDYITTKEQYNQSMGGNGSIKPSNQ